MNQTLLEKAFGSAVMYGKTARAVANGGESAPASTLPPGLGDFADRIGGTMRVDAKLMLQLANTLPPAAKQKLLAGDVRGALGEIQKGDARRVLLSWAGKPAILKQLSKSFSLQPNELAALLEHYLK